MWDVDPSTGDFSNEQSIDAWAFAGDMVDLPDGRLYWSMAPSSDSSGDSSLVILDPASDAVLSDDATGIGSL